MCKTRFKKKPPKKTKKHEQFKHFKGKENVRARLINRLSFQTYHAKEHPEYKYYRPFEISILVILMTLFELFPRGKKLFDTMLFYEAYEQVLAQYFGGQVVFVYGENGYLRAIQAGARGDLVEILGLLTHE